MSQALNRLMFECSCQRKSGVYMFSMKDRTTFKIIFSIWQGLIHELWRLLLLVHSR